MAAKTLGGRRLPRFSPNEAFRTVERLLFFPRGGDGGGEIGVDFKGRALSDETWRRAGFGGDELV